MRRPAAVLTCLLAVLLAVAGCGSSKKSGGTTTAAANPPPSAPADNGPCKTVAAPKPKGPQHLSKPTLKLDPAKHYVVTVATNCGSFDIALDVKRAPKTSASFASLVKMGFYDGLTFHRIAPGFVIQGGDPLGTGAGGPGYQVVERPPSREQYTRGVVAMAKTATDPSGASGSQFFVVTGEDAQLPPEYAIAGKVTKGLNTVDEIGAVELKDPQSQDGPPAQPIVIEKATLSSS